MSKTKRFLVMKQKYICIKQTSSTTLKRQSSFGYMNKYDTGNMAENLPDFHKLQRRCDSLHREVETLRADLNSLKEITTQLSHDVEAQPVFDTVLERAMALTGARSGSLMIIEENFLTIVASRGLEPEIARGSHPRLGEGIAGWVAAHGQPLLLAGKARTGPLSTGRAIKDALSVPLVTGDEPLGVLNVSNSPRGRQFIQDDLNLLLTFAGQAAVALKLLRTREKTEEAFISVIQALAEVIDAKDPYTAGHSRRCSDYATQLARRLGLRDDQIEMIGLAALLHDIGKIGISEEILRKPLTLDTREYGQIRTHPVISAKILEPVPALQETIPIIRHHHERYDGQGYPAGLKGEEIPMGARILAIVDAFDAVASGRAYKRVLPLQEVLGELKEHRKDQFDPHLLDVFIEAVGAGRISISSAIIVGQENPAPPMSAEEIATFATDQPQTVLDILRLVTDRLLASLSDITGSKLAENLRQSFELAAAENNIALSAGERGLESFSLYRGIHIDCVQYMVKMRDLLVEVIGPRLTERLLVDIAVDLDQKDRRLVVSCLSQMGIELPRENNKT